MTMRLSANSNRFLAMLASVAMLVGTPFASAPVFAQSKGPDSVADLAAPLLDSVVNIATTQNSKREGTGPRPPQSLDDAPFKELFEDFFKEGDKNQGGRISSQGSGFVIDAKGYVVTNNHVIADADTIEVVFANGKKLKAELVGTDAKTDLSVLKVEPKEPLTALKFGDSRALRIGDWVMAIGNPFGLGGSVSVGIVSARGRNINSGPYDYFIQTDAAINKGNSGGPLFNMQGEVIGVNTAIISPTGGSIGIGFSVPTELAKNIVDQIIENGKVQRGWLGVRVQPVTEEVVATLSLEEERGAMVSSLIESGPVANGPLAPGDVILSLDGKEVREVRDLLRIVAESRIDTPINAEIIRDGKKQTVSVSLAKLDESVEEEADAEIAIGEGEGEGEASPEGENTPGVEELLEVPEGEDGTSDGEADSEAEREAPKTVLKMRLVVLSNALRAEKNIVESVEGVLIEDVAPGSLAEQKGIKAGDVIVEVGQDFMEVPGDVLVRVNGLKSEGRRNANLLISNPEGDLRVVALPIE
jgi:serine protease Do